MTPRAAEVSLSGFTLRNLFLLSFKHFLNVSKLLQICHRKDKSQRKKRPFREHHSAGRFKATLLPDEVESSFGFYRGGNRTQTVKEATQGHSLAVECQHKWSQPGPDPKLFPGHHFEKEAGSERQRVGSHHVELAFLLHQMLHEDETCEACSAQ